MVNGNRPYRDTKPIPLHPEGSKGKCTSCHACVKMCPVGAITMGEPYKTNEKKCISCGRCVVVCPEQARLSVACCIRLSAGNSRKRIRNLSSLNFLCECLKNQIAMSRYKNIVFDVGSVLVNWMRMNLYTTLFNGNKA